MLLTLYHTVLTFNDPVEEACGKHCGKRRKCWKPPISPSATMFSILSKREIILLEIFKLSSANAFSLGQSKILLFGKELRPAQPDPCRTFLIFLRVKKPIYPYIQLVLRHGSCVAQ